MCNSTTEASEATVGRRLADLRAGRSMSQKVMADQLGVSLRAYQSYERSEREVPASLLATLFDVFQVEPLWLLKGSEASTEHAGAGMTADMALVVSSIRAVETWLEKRQKHMEGKSKAEFIGLVYGMSHITGIVDMDAVGDLMKIIDESKSSIFDRPTP